MGKKILVGSNFNFKNRIINGDFQIWQRGEDVTKSKLASGYYGVDRFFIWNYGIDSNGNRQPALDIRNLKSTDGKVSTSKFIVTDVDTSLSSITMGITQRVEPINYWDIIGKKVTISYWVKSNRTELIHYVSHRYKDSNGNAIGEWIDSTTINLEPDVWTKFTRTFLLDSENFTTIENELFTELFGLRLLDPTVDDYIELKQIQLEVGNIATEFEYIPYDIQLLRCMRYYEWFHIDYSGFDNANTVNSTNTISFKVKKRVLPSIRCVYAYDESTSQQLNPYFVNDITTQNARIYNDSSGSGWGANHHMHFGGIIDAEI